MAEEGSIIVYSEEDYCGDSQKFTVDHRSLEKDGWSDLIASFEIGPNTIVTFYEEEDYGGNYQKLQKNHRSLHEFGLHQSINSFTIEAGEGEDEEEEEEEE
eukprot:TRINITY_DN325_c1_g1_i1.p2 TRINITY_DN325_c1_g1~~TRINITY_DN325_c1_g1_i1.p2  ORF type:complete len:101 (-),score=32.71 TRINITY_DN325_c1_g1_i1:91-393(-)